MFPIKNVDCKKIGDETLVSFKFHEPWFFERLKYDDEDYIVYVVDSRFIPRRVWLKTIVPELQNKKIIFNDIDYHNDFVEIYFRETND